MRPRGGSTSSKPPGQIGDPGGPQQMASFSAQPVFVAAPQPLPGRREGGREGFRGGGLGLTLPLRWPSPALASALPSETEELGLLLTLVCPGHLVGGVRRVLLPQQDPQARRGPAFSWGRTPSPQAGWGGGWLGSSGPACGGRLRPLPFA